MRNLLGFSLLALAFFAASASAQVQQGPPNIAYVFPAGAQQGSEVTVTIGGQFLQSPTAVHFTGEGVEATIVEYFKPLQPFEAQRLRERVKELSDRKRDVERASKQPSTAPATGPTTTATWTEADEKTLAELIQKLSTFRPKLPPPSLQETVTLKVKVAPDAARGPHSIRLTTFGGLTNPVTFQVDSLAETREQEDPLSARPQEVAISTLPAILNGQIMPGDVDRYRFNARQGQKIVASVSARALIPYIADAVPGWFQATLAIYDSKGKELAFTDDFRGNPDPAMCFEAPADGEYILEIRDSIYRGREDFVYRIALGQLPFVTNIYPLGTQRGTSRTVQLAGWNLPATQISTDGEGPLLPDGTINQVPFAVDDLPDASETEPNDAKSKAQPVHLGTIVNGRIDRPGDWDHFSVDAKAGEEIVAEVSARRLGSALDSMLYVIDASGKTIASNDDTPDVASGLSTHHADARVSFRAPAAGRYDIRLGDTQGKGGSDYAYRLRISGPMHDYDLLVSPSSLTVRPGGVIPLTVHAVRRDGFAGEIALSVEGSTGCQINGGRIPAGQDKVRVTLSAPANASEGFSDLRISGTAAIGGKQVVRSATVAQDMMQAFAYRHLVPVSDLNVLISGRQAPRMSARILSELPLRLKPGETAQLLVSAPPNTWWGPISYVLSEPPEGIEVASTTQSPKGSLVLIKSAADAKPFDGNLILQGYSQPKAATTQPAARPANQRRLVLTLPAVPCVLSK